jgi:GxxExxY protein
MDTIERDPLTANVIGCAMRVHTKLGWGFLESVYQNALKIELEREGLRFETSKPIQVRYDGISIGEFVADALVEEKLLLELKAVRALAVAHGVQLVHYLTATGIDFGLLLNFGAERLQVKRKFRVHQSIGFKL